MKRAKKPPPQNIIDDAAIMGDVLLLGRLTPELELRLNELVLLAMQEYLRRFPKNRKMNDDPWVVMPLRDGQKYKNIEGYLVLHSGETDFQCMFCRKSINTLARYKIPNKEFCALLRTNHIDLCAMQFLAGMKKPHAPLPTGEPGL